MARSLHIGTVDLADATAWERYFSKLNYLELSGPFGGPVKDATLKRWRQASGGRLGLHAPWVLSHRKAPASARAGGYDTDAQSGDFRTGPAAQRALARWTTEAWTTATGEKACRTTRQGARCDRYLPRAAWAMLSPAEAAATRRTKLRASTQYVPNEHAARAAGKRARRTR